MGTRHAFTSAAAASVNQTEVDGPRWNAEHLAIPEYVPLLVSSSNTVITLLASAAANTEVFPTSRPTRRELDLSTITQVRLRAMVIANGNVTTASVKLQWTLTETVAWSGSDTGLSLVLGTGTTGLLRDTGWVDLPAAARVPDVTLALVVGVAFGTTAPTIGSAILALR